MNSRILLTLALVGLILFVQLDAKAIKHKKHNKKAHIKHKKADGNYSSLFSYPLEFNAFIVKKDKYSANILENLQNSKIINSCRCG